MGTIVTHIEREQRTFAESPFAPADSPALSSLAYFDFESTGLVSAGSDARVRLHDVVALVARGTTCAAAPGSRTPTTRAASCTRSWRAAAIATSTWPST